MISVVGDTDNSRNVTVLATLFAKLLEIVWQIVNYQNVWFQLTLIQLPKSFSCLLIIPLTIFDNECHRRLHKLIILGNDVI